MITDTLHEAGLGIVVTGVSAAEYYHCGVTDTLSGFVKDHLVNLGGNTTRGQCRGASQQQNANHCAH